jgi:hypothetical protein
MMRNIHRDQLILETKTFWLASAEIFPQNFPQRE